MNTEAFKTLCRAYYPNCRFTEGSGSVTYPNGKTLLSTLNMIDDLGNTLIIRFGNSEPYEYILFNRMHGMTTYDAGLAANEPAFDDIATCDNDLLRHLRKMQKYYFKICKTYQLKPFCNRES